jgi:MurNAc alpha-1-phosphate uridylyltransferase
MNTTPTFPVVILAGGLATRLRPLTETIPKALLEINGTPFITHQLNLLHQQGIRHVVLCVGYLGTMLEEYLNTHSPENMQIQFSYDGETLLGTGGAIKKALPLITDNFFVLYGDSYLPCDFQKVQTHFLSENKSGLMTVYHNTGKWDTSNVEFTDNTIKNYDKINRTENMHHIDYGLGIFNKQAFSQIPDNTPYDLAVLYQNLLKQNQLTAHEVTQRFYEIGSFAGIEELGYYLTQNKLQQTQT